MTATTNRGRLAPRHRRLLQLAYDHVSREMAWPQVARLQHELARKGDPFDVRKASSDLDSSLGRADRISSTGQLVLTIKGVRRCDGAGEVLSDFVRVVAYFVRRYLDSSDLPAEVTRAEMQRDLDLSDRAVRAIQLLLDSSNIPTAGGGGSEDDWRWLIDEQILRFRAAKTINQVIRRAYPPGPVRISSDSAPGFSFGGQLATGAAVRSRVALGPALEATDWTASVPGWGSVEQRLVELHSELVGASTKDDWQDIGRRCREILIEAANVVFLARMVPHGGEVPGAGDARARLGCYLEARAPELADETHAFVRSTLRLANALTHHSKMGRLEAVGCVQAVILTVRMLQEIELLPRRGSRSSTSRPNSPPAL